MYLQYCVYRKGVINLEDVVIKLNNFFQSYSNHEINKSHKKVMVPEMYGTAFFLSQR